MASPPRQVTFSEKLRYSFDKSIARGPIAQRTMTMKHLSFSVAALLSAALCGTVLCGQSAPAQPAKTPDTKRQLVMPPEVRAMMAPGARTLHFARLPIGINGAPVLFHAWKIGRHSSQTEAGTSVPAPVCLDFFSRRAATGAGATGAAATGGKWELVSSVSYLSLGSEYPGGISYATYWLKPKAKQGLVVVERNAGSTGTTFRVITLPQGVAEGSLDEFGHPAYVQEFHASTSGGGESRFISFKRNARGQMTIEEEILPHAASPQILNIYAWNGDKWAKVATRKKSQR